MAMTLITTNTSSNAASSSFTSGIDSTYKLYIFKFIDINPATDGTYLGFQANAVDASGYNETITSTCFQAYHSENDSSAALSYDAAGDQAQGTAFQRISSATIGNGGDESCAGELFLFNPSNTTYVKHFYSVTNSSKADDETMQIFTAGYFNITAAIDDIQFKMASGNMDAVIKMYGVG
jgi:hypothetical protein